MRFPKQQHGYRSKFELSIAKDLNKRKQSFGYESESLRYILRKKYKPDFIINTSSGKTLYCEAKGRFFKGDPEKMVAVRKCNPDKDIRFIFMNGFSKTRKGAKETMGEWATRNGFKWCETTIPAKWFQE